MYRVNVGKIKKKGMRLRVRLKNPTDEGDMV